MNLINQLFVAMIEYDKGDPKRIQHFTKVYAYAKLIGEMEQLSSEQQLILEAAALTHDIGIHVSEEKYGDCSGKHQEQEGPAIAKELLEQLGFEASVIDRVCFLIGHHHTYTNITEPDYQILVEADFLVNLYEDGLDMSAVKSVEEKIFKTAGGKQLLRTMF